MFKAVVLADSSYGDCRLTTVEATFPRSILAEWNTHAMIRRNAASSRAIPVKKMIERVEENPFVPEFSLNKKGMQAGDPLEEGPAQLSRENWLAARDFNARMARVLQSRNIHKQYANRLLEPWMWTTIIATATDWDNMFAQRFHPAAEPSFQRIAELIYIARNQSEPKPLGEHGWHLPLIAKDEEEQFVEILKQPSSYYPLVLGTLIKRGKVSEMDEAARIYSMERFQAYFRQDVSVGRCARISLLTHAGVRDPFEDIALAAELSSNKPGHWSPFEHVARPAKFREMKWRIDQLRIAIPVPGYDDPYVCAKNHEMGYCGAFHGFKPYRHFYYPDENIERWEGPTHAFSGS